jgi:signal transduction histidine kinase
MPEFTAADLRPVDLFDGLTDDELAGWAQVAELVEVAAGETVVDHTFDTPGLYLLLDGIVRAVLADPGTNETVGRQHAPTWLGAIGVLTSGGVRVRIEAETACRFALIPSDDFKRFMFEQPSVNAKVMDVVAPVIQRITGMSQHRERLASLGTMAAGLTHELNNPAAAAVRSAAQLAEALTTVNDSFRAFVESGVEREDAARMFVLHEEAMSSKRACTILDELDLADLEDEVQDRLEALGVPEPWTLAEPLARANLGADWIDRMAEAAGATALPAAVRWVAASLGAISLATELEETTKRMSELIGAVKSYAYLDRGDSVEVDVHEGLETTLTVLGHKLKHTTIDVVREYDRSLPKVTVYGSALNQVWTNLLDNAIDALDGSGTLTIRTRPDGGCVLVEVEDTGSGIPDDVRERIFDPFFTTKDVGRGTGLGLATARQIIVDRHGGSMTVDSSPAGTTFHVWIPVRPPEDA